MAGGLWMRLGCLMAALGLAASAAAEPAPGRIVAVGDLHGDFAAWRAIAEAAGVIDRRGRWRGGRTVLVQLGDVPDRGPDTLKIIDDLMRLQREAPRAGGRVYALVGNHEAMNVTGDLRYVTREEYAAFADRRSARLRESAYELNRAAIEASYRRSDPSLTPEAIRQAWMEDFPLGFIEHRAAWRPQGRIGKWVVGNPAVVQLGETLFVHGGLCPPYAGRPIAELNREVADALAAENETPEAIINHPDGPLWCRRLGVREGGAGAAAQAQPPIADLLDQALAPYGARRMVIGHTPVLSGVAVAYEGRLVRIDTGISAAYGGKLSWLEIAGDRLEPREVARPAASASRAR